jgi:hypothetical protein
LFWLEVVLIEGLILGKFAENYFVYFVYSQVFRLCSRLFSKYFDFVYSQSISSILKILRVFPNYFGYSQSISISFILKVFLVFSKYYEYSQIISVILKVFRFRLFSKYFLYSQIISFILNLTAFYSHLVNINPSVLLLNNLAALAARGVGFRVLHCDKFHKYLQYFNNSLKLIGVWQKYTASINSFGWYCS